MLFLLICALIFFFNLDLFYFNEEFIIFVMLSILFAMLFFFFKRLLSFYFFNQIESTYLLFIYLIRSSICIYSKLYNALIFDHYFYYFYSFLILRTFFIQGISRLNFNFYFRINKYIKSITTYLLSGFFVYRLTQSHYSKLIVENFLTSMFISLGLYIYVILFFRHEVSLMFVPSLYKLYTFNNYVSLI